MELRQRLFFSIAACGESMNIMQSPFPLMRRSRGMMSLPIMLLLLLLITLSYRFYQPLASQHQWNYQQYVASEQQQIWQEFMMDVVIKATSNMAQESECDGFCPLDETTEADWQQLYTWQSQSELKTDASFTNLYWFLERNTKKTPYYRLCAQRLSLEEIKCWWYEETAGELTLLSYMPM